MTRKAPPATGTARHRPGTSIAMTMGEPAGIGGEIALKAWLNHRGLPPFFVIDDPSRLADLVSRLGLPITLRKIGAPEEAAAVFPDALPVYPLALPKPAIPGRLDLGNAAAVQRAIETATEFAMAGRVSAIVTNPIQKQILYKAGFGYPGHTEFLAALAGSTTRPVMMLACSQLRVIPVTIHIGLRRALDALTTDVIVETAIVTAKALWQDFGIAAPRLAIAGLNPHAGEGGTLGSEEVEIVEPAVRRIRAQGVNGFGPLPPDAMFSIHARANYDAAICMYHDQALIPIKTIDFDNTVNVTLGLPIVRTSPDHGTALDIAGQGKAREHSLVAALRMAAEIAARRETKPISHTASA